MEIWDVYNAERIKTGKTAIRGNELAVGDYHLVVHVCIFNEQGEMLIQQRQPFKEGWPNYWDVTCGGSATFGDTSQQAAARELFEEMGIPYSFDNMRPQFTINFDRGFDDWYLIQHDVALDTLVLQPEEVQKAKWASCEEVLAMMAKNTFIPYYEPFIRMLFDMRTSYGSINKSAVE